MDIDQLIDQLQQMRRRHGRVMVDCEHDDSGMDFDVERVKRYTNIDREGVKTDRVSLVLVSHSG